MEPRQDLPPSATEPSRRSATPPRPKPPCWRVTGLGRWGTGVAFGGLSVIAAVDNAVAGHSILSGLQLGMLLMPVWYLAAIRPRVCLDPEHVVVRNPLWTHRIPVGDIRGAEPGYFGVIIRRTGRLPVTAWAVQETNAAAWAGLGTRAHQLADAITALTQAGDEGAEEDEEPLGLPPGDQ